ncbi:DrmB family protein [Streptomyces sp. Act-28]
MSRRRVRQAQTVVPFGTGAVLDVQGESFVAAGIGDWPRAHQPVSSPRLAARLGVSGFRAAPPAPHDAWDVPDAAGPPYIRFPAWLFCPACRRMTHWRVADERPGQPPRCRSCSPQRQLTPMRFVQICPSGHLGDVDWWYWAHSELTPEQREACTSREHLRFRFEERATGLEALSVACTAPGCPRPARDLLDVLGAKRLRCTGRNPWQRRSEAVKDCPGPVQIVQRTAGNLYYPVVHSALDIPETGASGTDGELAERVRLHEMWLALCKAPDGPRAPLIRSMITEDTGADDALLDALLAEETGVPADQPVERTHQVVYPDLSSDEWAAFTAPAPEPTRDFVIREMGLGLEDGLDAPWADLRDKVARVIVVDRLREVRAIQGFTRVTPTAKFVPVDTSRRARWLPAVEVFGEGVFLTLDERRLAEWERDRAVRARVRGLRDDLDRAFQKDRLEALTGPELLPRFVLLHTFAHLLIRQLSFESGYSTASLRERVYARSGGAPQAGVLVYTAAGDAEGTLGGLVRQGEPPRLAETLLRLTETAAWCSADPLCAEHTGQGYANLNRAACHACCLLPETSCETGNALLDRVLLVGGSGVPGYFEDVITTARELAAREIEDDVR